MKNAIEFYRDNAMGEMVTAKAKQQMYLTRLAELTAGALKALAEGADYRMDTSSLMSTVKYVQDCEDDYQKNKQLIRILADVEAKG